MYKNEKIIFNEKNFDYSTANIGDYVEEKVVDNVINCLPPITMSSDCTQLGEPFCHAKDTRTDKCRAVYSTFKRVDNEIWEYCGLCFSGENKDYRLVN